MLLAAGSSARFGSNKLLTVLPNGLPMAVAACRNLLAALPDVVSVLRRDDAELDRLLSACGARVIGCADAEKGIGHTLAHAVRSRREASGWVVALADMPRVRPHTISAIVNALSAGAGIAAPRFRGRRGHPVGFSARYGAQLAQLSGDSGARSLLIAEQAAIEWIDVDDQGTIIDIDEPSDLSRYGYETN